MLIVRQQVTEKMIADALAAGARDVVSLSHRSRLQAVVERELRARGYTVARNDPYKGVQLIARIGQPAQRRHSLQIEIRRPIYMDEVTRERSADFDTVQRDLAALAATLARYAREHGFSRSASSR